MLPTVHEKANVSWYPFFTIPGSLNHSVFPLLSTSYYLSDYSRKHSAPLAAGSAECTERPTLCHTVAENLALLLIFIPVLPDCQFQA